MRTFAGWLAPLLLITAPVWAQTAAPDRAGVSLWRLDCGSMPAIPLAMFSDTFGFIGETADMPVSCYLIRHGDQYMVWNTGFGTEYIDGHPEGQFDVVLKRSLVDQLADLGVAPEQVSVVGISHDHGDHIGQAASFPKARLLMGAADLATLRAGADSARIAPWLSPDSNAEGVSGDRDVFGDGSVVMLATPGHTEGHRSLLVRLARMGPVLLTGDAWHFRAQMADGDVPPYNWNRAATLASRDRLGKLAENLHATVIIEHDREDLAKLPAAPSAAH